MSDRTRAWVLDVGGPFLIAISEHEMVEVLETPVSSPVLRGPDYCKRVFVRHNEIMPLIDLSKLSPIEEQDLQEDAISYTVILAYQEASDEMVSRAGLMIRKTPKGITVGNEMEILPPGDIPSEWKGLMIGCFEWERNTVLIPDLMRLLVPEVSLPRIPL